MSNFEGLYFLPLGGASEIGMNLNLYACDDEWLMVDLGISFHDRLGIDVVMPNPQFIVERRAKLKGLLLTHAHEDHIGAIPYLWHQLQCPLYATPFTAHLIRYKLEEAGLIDRVTLIELPLSGTCEIGPFAIQMVTLTHSIPEPNGVMIRTKYGNIFHTGDWKIDPDPLVGERTDEATLKAIGQEGVLAMVCDSTNVFQEESSGSEKDVFENLQHVGERYKNNRLIVTCFSSNIARLQSIGTVAQKMGRTVIAAGRSLARMEKAAREQGYLKHLNPFLTVKQGANLPPEKTLIVCTGSQGEGRSVLKRMASGSYPGVKLSDEDVIVFSSRIIPGNDKRIGFLKNMLLRQGCHIVAQHNADIHVSGHPGRIELRQMYDWIKPRIAIPVHGELQHLIEHGRLAHACGVPEVLIVENGALVHLAPQEADIVEFEIPNGYLALDGKNVIRMDHAALKERAKLSYDGVVLITVLIDTVQRRLIDTCYTMKGLVNQENVVEISKQLVTETTRALLEHEIVPARTRFVQEITAAARRPYGELMDKKPQCIVHVLDIAAPE